jgi:transposase
MDVNKKTRRQWSAEQKLRIIEEARQTGHTVSEVCQQYQINLKQFYDWERQAKRGALEGLRQGNRKIKPDDGQQRLEQEVLRLREVIVELSTENLGLKKGGWE